MTDLNPDKKKLSFEMAAVVLLIVVFLFVSFLRHNPFTSTNPAGSLGIIVAAGITLIMYSFLYRDNALFKIAENLYVGVALGYLVVIVWRNSLLRELYEPFFHAHDSQALSLAFLHRTVPILLGLLLLTRISKTYGWMSRYSYALMIGWGAGVAIPVATNSFILHQLHAALVPFQGVATTAPAAQAAATHPILAIFGAIFLMIGTVSVLFYFFFSIEHKRPAAAAVSRLGILFLMVSFGAAFGYAVMGRASLLIGRIEFLLFDWLKINH